MSGKNSKCSSIQQISLGILKTKIIVKFYIPNVTYLTTNDTVWQHPEGTFHTPVDGWGGFRLGLNSICRRLLWQGVVTNMRPANITARDGDTLGYAVKYRFKSGKNWQFQRCCFSTPLHSLGSDVILWEQWNVLMPSVETPSCQLHATC